MAGLPLTDEEVAMPMTFDGTSFQAVWVGKEKDLDEISTETNSLHRHVALPSRFGLAKIGTKRWGFWEDPRAPPPK